MSKHPRLGDCLRALRHAHGLTLQQVSTRTGLALSTLSKVENHQMSLTYDKILQLCDGLGIPMTELLTQDTAAAATRTRVSVAAPANTLVHDTPNYEYFYLSTDLTDKRMVPLIATVRARTLEEFGPLVKHPGEEFIYVVSGEIEVHTEHYAPLRLEAGQSCYIDSTMGHAYLAVGAGEARIVGVCSSQEPRLHDVLVGAVAQAADG